MAAGSASQSPFAVRGVVEGFYGVYYTVAQRLDLLAFLGAHGFNWYLYGPKDDRYHRRRWREPYPPAALADFAAMVQAAERAGLTFCYALSPGLSISYAAPEDCALVVAKLKALHGAGVRAFSLFLDDIDPAWQHAADAARFGSYAAAHVDLCHRTLAWLRAYDPACTLSMCPTTYHGREPFDAYLAELGAALDPAIDVFYTGPEVCSPTLTAADARGFEAVAQRPPLIWDNYPVNDGHMAGELHIGPLRGRAADLAGAVRGVFFNPMNEVEASKVPLQTCGAYLADPAAYDPEAAWAQALAEAAGPAAGALRAVAENSLYSCLGTPEAPRLTELTAAALAALAQGASAASDPAVAALLAEVLALEDAFDALRYRLPNVPLRAELLPWLEQLENWCRVGRHAIGWLRASDAATAHRLRGYLQGAITAARAHPKRIGGQALAPLADFALARAGEVEAHGD